MTARMRRHDWAATPLGPLEAWPQTLRVATELMLASPGASCLVCGPERLVLYNDAAARLCGVHHPAALGAPLGHGFPVAHPALEGLFARAFAGESLLAHALPIAVPGGAAGLFDARFTPLREGDGPVRWVHVTAQESGAHLAAQRLQENEALLRSLFEAIDDAVMVIERLPLSPAGQRNWRYVAMNGRAGAMFRKPDLTGQTVRDNFPEEDEAWYDIYDQVLESGQPLRFERESVPQAMILEMFVTRVRGHGDTRLMVVMRDVTERRQAADSLQRNEARQAFMLTLNDRMRALADPIDVMALSSELLGRYLGAGRCGYGEVDATGEFFIVERDWTDGVMESAKGRHRCDDFGAELIAANRAGECVAVDDAREDPRTRGVLPTFEAIGHLRSSLAMPMLKQGRWCATLFVQHTHPRHWTYDEQLLVREVAERTWSAVDRARAEGALRAADARKDEFLATLAHELRNPLAPIRGALLLLRSGRAPVEARALQAIIERQVDHMVRLVDDLLDVSRISRGAIELRREPLDLRAVLRTAVETSTPAIDDGRHVLTLDLPGEPLGVEGDAVRLAQVFANLLNNAAKYSDQGGRIVLSAWRDRQEVVVSVRDNGVGIAADHLERVFELFGQAERFAARTQGGLGIGLNLAQRLVAMHGGSIQARSEGAGQGSEFLIRLPFLAPAATAAFAALAPEVALGAHRILIVDDNRDAADTLSMLLRMQGAETRVAHDGPAALRQLEDWLPSAVLLDIGMPGMSGHEVARRIRADARLDGVMLVALTGWGQEADRQRTREAGFDHHLTKPVAFEVLLATLASPSSVRLRDTAS
ncbi:MAG: ATP-binding protein [Candidatus Dactylopiibacterium sp.]|nr:ATP-binding protein [Candidatus Dactylopiibacterium sp.]